MPRTLERQLLLGFVFVAVVVAAITAISVITTRGLIDTTDEQDEAQALNTAVANVLALTLDLETGHRGYLLTGDEDFLGPYDEALAELEPALSRIDQLVRTPAERQLATALRAAVVAKRNIVAESVDFQREGNEQAALERVFTGESRARMDAVRTAVDQLQTTVSARVRQSTDDQENWSLRATVVVVALGAAVLAIFLTGLWLISRERARSQAALARERESEARFQSLFASMDDAVMAANINRIATTTNPAFDQLFGYPDGSFAGHPTSDLYASDADWAETGTRVRVHGRHRMETEMRRADGSTFPADVALAALHDDSGRMTGVIGVTRDITARKEAEAHIGELNRTLELRARELEATNAELESFSYSVSHDLRAPLRAIDGFSQILVEDYGDRLDDEGHRSLDRIRKASERMGNLIDDLLALSRVTRADLRAQSVDLTTLAGSVASELSRAEPGRQVEWVIPPGLTAYADPYLLRIALTNLLGNAFKFTAKHPTACIEIGSTTVDGERTYFVKDDGAGFDMEYASKLFGAFQRLHAAEDFEGTGIGLATVQRIIRRHGGRVWAEGAVEQGATFWFTLGEEAPA